MPPFALVMVAVPLFHRVYGLSGPPIVILHGFLGSLDNWVTLARLLSQTHQVWLVDQRNHGLSPHADDFDYHLLAADLLAWMDAQGLTRVTLAGHSMGGKTAMQFAALYPERVEKLMVVDIAPRAYPVHHDRILSALAAVDLQATTRQQAEAQLAQGIPEPGTRQFLLKSLYRHPEGGFAWRFNLPVLQRQVAQVVADLLPADVVFEGPTLFVAGSESDYIGQADKDLIRHRFPQARIISVKGAGHWVHADKPAELLEIFKRF